MSRNLNVQSICFNPCMHMRDTTPLPKLTISQQLRARDLVMLVMTATRYIADIAVTKHFFRVDGKSSLGLLELNARPSDTLQIFARGDDAGEAINAFGKVITAAVNGRIEDADADRSVQNDGNYDRLVRDKI